jgi:ribonucleotide reductase alpha subunit
MAIGRYVAQRAGIGINAGRIRGINAKIRGGEVQHTGVVPFLKSLKQLSDAAHKTASEVGQRLFTFLSGTKK